MFAYNAGGVTDRSGELIAQGANNAAMLQAEAMGNFGQNMGNTIAQFAKSYADDKSLKAKGEAYGDFLKRHGEQLGLDGEYLDGLLKMKPRELAVAGDSFLGMGNAGNRLMGLNYMNQQANLFSGNRGTGTGGGGGGASAPAATGGSSFTF